MEKERKITAPEGCEIEKVELVNGVAVVTFREKKRKIPKTWEEFGETYTVPFAFRPKCDPLDNRRITTQVNIPCVMADFTDDPELSGALVALIKLILLRNCYNEDWVPDWEDSEKKWVILFSKKSIEKTTCTYVTASELYFKTEELRDEFFKYFRPLIEKLKPLYGIKEGGEEC
jgi:hypothetical protein